jgi:hypothetical protein
LLPITVTQGIVRKSAKRFQPFCAKGERRFAVGFDRKYRE